MKRQKSWFLGLLIVLALVAMPCLGMADEMKATPIATDVGAWEQLSGVLMIPVDILLAMTYAEGEMAEEGRLYEGDYARHGYNRKHARWWDPFFFHHGK